MITAFPDKGTTAGAVLIAVLLFAFFNDKS